MNFTKEKFIKSIFVLSVLSIILIIALSFFVLQFSGNGNDGNNSGNNPAEIAAPARKTPEVILPKVLYNLSGKITEIEKGAVTFSATIFSKDSKGGIVSDIESRKANIDSATNIKRLFFVKNSPVESAIKLSDLKVGDYIEVISDRDISDSAEFPATVIRALP
ncbi:hypothetical protein KJ854_06185 [Patescibacteria group bacterium]|nr:hypothetical protein [Patescibacteria group bacterium]